MRLTTKLSCDVKLCVEFWCQKIIKIRQLFLNLQPIIWVGVFFETRCRCKKERSVAFKIRFWSWAPRTQSAGEMRPLPIPHLTTRLQSLYSPRCRLGALMGRDNAPKYFFSKTAWILQCATQQQCWQTHCLQCINGVDSVNYVQITSSHWDCKVKILGLFQVTM